MTRRILLVLLAFTVVIIAGAMVPLALYAATHDQTSFIQATAGTANTYAAVAQSRLDAISGSRSDSSSTGQADTPLLSVLRQVRQAGDGLLILESNDQTLTNQNMPQGDWIKLAQQAATAAEHSAQVHQSAASQARIIGSRVVAVVPVYKRGLSAPVVGTVLLARSTAPLDRDILELWVILGTIGVVAMLMATALAFALARWVSRPLAGLDGAAGRLADGDLAIRAVVDSGPPELRRLATTFNTMAGRLEALVHGNRAVIADVSHQLRTPLAALRLRLDLLTADTAQSDPDTAHELAGALEELARLSRLVDGLLAVARAENVVPVPVAVDVSEAAIERVAAWHPVADDRGIALSHAGGPAMAWIGEGHLEQILDNLIANALDALSAGDQVTVTAAVTVTGAQVIVSDNGPGMTAEDRGRAFLRFSTSNPNGTGLGLAIVHRLVTSNGGTANLTQTPGGGLTVTLDFPAAAAVAGPGAAVAGPGATVAGPGAQDMLIL